MYSTYPFYPINIPLSFMEKKGKEIDINERGILMGKQG
jgi:hypothetical protein